MPWRIGCVSDTHLPAGRPLPGWLLEGLAGVDQVLHAGDIVDREVLEQLAAIAPVTAVAGNLDPPALQAALGTTQLITVGPVAIGLTHGHRGAGAGTLERAASHFPTARVVVFGHSHRALCEWRGERLFLNPGSPTQPRWARAPSFGVLWVGDDGSVRGEIVFHP